MKIIIGLGNPGKQYEKTRHNSGFIILEELKAIFNFPEFSLNNKFNAEISEGYIKPLLPPGEGARRADEGDGDKIILAKP